jgi:hypothetical protein
MKNNGNSVCSWVGDGSYPRPGDSSQAVSQDDDWALGDTIGVVVIALLVLVAFGSFGWLMFKTYLEPFGDMIKIIS